MTLSQPRQNFLEDDDEDHHSSHGYAPMKLFGTKLVRTHSPALLGCIHSASLCAMRRSHVTGSPDMGAACTMSTEPSAESPCIARMSQALHVPDTSLILVVCGMLRGRHHH